MLRTTVSLAFLTATILPASNARAFAGRTETVPPAVIAREFPHATMQTMLAWNLTSGEIPTCADTEAMNVPPALYGSYEMTVHSGRSPYFSRATITLGPQGITSFGVETNNPRCEPGRSLTKMAYDGYCARSRMGRDGSIRLTLKKTGASWYFTPYLQGSTNLIVSADAAGNPVLSMVDEFIAVTLLAPFPIGDSTSIIREAPLTRVAP